MLGLFTGLTRPKAGFHCLQSLGGLAIITLAFFAQDDAFLQFRSDTSCTKNCRKTYHETQ